MEKRVRLIPPGYLLLTLIASTVLHYFAPFARLLPSAAALPIGIVLVVVGIVSAGLGAAAFNKAGTAIRPFDPATALVREGIYRYTRNPMYVGLLLISLGAATAFGTLSAFLPPVMFFFILRNRFVLPEEEFLRRTFGDEYAKYTQQVRRWI